MEQQAVAGEAGRMQGDGLGRGVERACDLAVAGTLDQLVTDGLEQFGALEPVAGAERLLAAVASTVATTETLDAVGWVLAAEEAGADPVPATRCATVVWTVFVGTARGHVDSAHGGHAGALLQTPRRLQSSEHNPIL